MAETMDISAFHLHRAELTPRELEIASLAAQGLSSKAIATRLYLSARTVDNYLGRVFAKVGVRSRRDLADVLASYPEG